MAVGMQTRVNKVHSARGIVEGLNAGFKLGKAAIKIGHLSVNALKAGGYGGSVPLQRFEHALDVADTLVQVVEPIHQHFQKSDTGAAGVAVSDREQRKAKAKKVISRAMREKLPGAVGAPEILGH